jgi:asparagine synthase (glutamine-hydrolysing)
VTQERLRPTPLEIATTTMLGDDPAAPPLQEVDPPLAPLEALEQAIRPALERPPCLVTFSGGRDSSAVLAVAAGLARREGLPEPVAITVRFRDAPGASEPEWQETVIDRLRLGDWVRVEVDDELDLVGPIAQRLLRRHGVVYPVNANLFALMLEHARGGSLLTGLAGDSVLGGWLYSHTAQALSGRVRPGSHDLLLAAYALTPRPGKRLAQRRRARRLPWLRPDAQRRFAEAVGDARSRLPLSFDAYLASLARSRSHRAASWTLSLLAADADALLADPLDDPGFVAALGRAGGRRGLGDRTAVMRLLFDGILPDELLTRPDKARFPYVYFRAPSRAFARRFDGEGLDPELVDPEILRAAWLALMPPGSSALALQAAWLASARRQVEQPAADLG